MRCLERIFCAEGRHVGLLGCFLEGIDSLVELLVGSVAVGKSGYGLCGNRVIAFRAELFERGNGFLNLAHLEIADTCLVVGHVTGIGRTVSFGNLRKAGSLCIAFERVLKVLLHHVFLHHVAEQFLCFLFAGLCIAVNVGERAAHDYHNGHDADDELFLVLADKCLGLCNLVVHVQCVLLFVLAHNDIYALIFICLSVAPHHYYIYNIVCSGSVFAHCFN